MVSAPAACDEGLAVLIDTAKDIIPLSTLLLEAIKVQTLGSLFSWAVTDYDNKAVVVNIDRAAGLFQSLVAILASLTATRR